MSNPTITIRAVRGPFVPMLVICLVLILGLGLLNFSRGAPNVGLAEVWQAIVAPAEATTSQAHFLIRELRIPRMLLATFCGMALGLVGVLLQDALRNPLADPGLLGIAQGAGFATALSAVYPELVPRLPQPLLCLIAGMVVGAVVVAFSGTIRDPVRIILTGAICSGFFGVLTSMVLLLAPYERSAQIGSYLRYVSGSVSAAEWSQLWMVAPWLALGIPAALLSGRALNLLHLGDELASGAGLDPFRARLLLIFIALVLMAPVIAAIGPVAFVALFAPHIARGLLINSDARQVLPLSALCGAVLLLAADTAGRLLFFPIEIPAGIWTVAMIGPAAVAVIGRTMRRQAV